MPLTLCELLNVLDRNPTEENQQIINDVYLLVDFLWCLEKLKYKPGVVVNFPEEAAQLLTQLGFNIKRRRKERRTRDRRSSLTKR